MNSRGLTIAEIAISAGLLILVVVGVWFYGIRDSSEPDTITCTQEAKLCPDGTAVGRTGPNCEFAECPKTDVREDTVKNETGKTVEHGNIVASENSTEWSVYTSEEWKYSFEYPSNYILSEEVEGYKVVVTPRDGFDGPAEWFSVVVIQYPDVESLEMIPETLFNQANYPDGKVAWLKDLRIYDYKNYSIEFYEVEFGRSSEYKAIRARENSINPKLDEYRSLVYVLRDPAVYRITHDLASEEVYGDTLSRIEDSFTVLE